MADKNQILTDEQIGLGATKPAAPKTLSDSDIGFEPPARGFKGWAQDVAATAVKGAIGVPEMLVGLADIPTGGRVGKFLENEGGAVGFRPKQAKEIVNDWHSDATKEAQRKFQQADGFMDKAVTAIQNPSTILTTVGESIPSMLAGGLAGRGIMATTKLGTMGTKGAALAGAAGEGLTMAGSAAEQIRQETEDGLLTPGQAAAAGLTGVVGAGLGALGGRVANKLGIGDVDTMIAQGAKGMNADVAAGAARAAANPMVQQSAMRSIPTKVVQGAISEGFLEELPQSVAEQVFQNLALGKDWHEDVDAAAVMGVLSGSAMGGAASGFRAFKESGAQSQEPGAQGVAGTDPAQPQAPSTGLQRVQSAFEAQLRALQEQEQGEPEVPQTAPPSGAELTAKQRAAALANRAADIDRDRSTMGPDDEIFQSTGMAAPLTPSQQMGLRSGPEAGTMEAAAALAVDTGAAGQMQQAAQAAQTAQQQQKGKGKQTAQAVDTETGEIVGAEGDFTTWSDQDLSNTFRSAQSRDVRLKLAKELARRREERDQAELRAELEAEQTALDLPNVDDGAFARMTEDAGDVPAELSQPLITNEGAQLVTQAPQAQQSQTAGQEAPNQGRTGAAVTAAQGGGVPAAGTTGVEAAGLTQSARPAAAPEGASPVDALRTQLREVEAKIMRAAPDAMGAGGGDIEAAMKSRKVPVPLKAQRKKLQEQIRKAQVTETQQFAPETGTLGIPRSEMPQVPSTSHGGLVKHLNAQGIAHETTTVDAASLKPTQAEFSPAKVEAAKAATGDRAVIVSKDGHIIDGHHQAVAAAQDGKTVKAIVLDAPVEQALAAVKASPSAQSGTGGDQKSGGIKLTADQTTSQIRWQDMGTKDGVHTHSLFFYETQEAFEANQGRMAYGTITKGDVSASKWSVDGVEGMFEGLADAKKAAVAHALERLRRDGYVQDEPTQTAPASTPEARFEQERAKGGQNAGINAFAKIAGATGESVTDVWQRWRSVMAFDDKVGKGAGADVAKAMQEQLLKAPWANDAVYPGDGRSMSPTATLHQWRVRAGKFAEQKESFSRELDREELRARDAENFGVPEEAVNQAREAVAAMRKRVIELEAEIKEGVAQAEAREEAAKSAEQKAYQDSFELPSQSVLAKKPTPTSIDNWSNPVEWRGKTVYTNGHFVDVTGTPPHIKDWESRKGIRQNLTTSATDRVLGMAGVRDGFPDNSHVKAEPLAVIDDVKSGRLFFDVQGELVSIDLKYARYFQSKVKGATFTANPNDLGGPMRVMDGDNLVGIVMPFRATIYDKSAKMTVADIRGYMAASGKDKPQSVVKRAQQAKEQDAQPAAVIKQVAPADVRIVVRRDVVGERFESQARNAAGDWEKQTSYTSMEDAKASLASMGYQVDTIETLVSEWDAGAKRFSVPKPETPTVEQPPRGVLAKKAEAEAKSADAFPLSEAASSYSGISHSGTQRAKSDAAEFEAYIERANAAGLALAETEEQKAAVEKATKDLRADYLKAYRRLMGVRAGTYSGFVAGRSGLNAKQADQRNSAYDRAIDEFVSWQKENDSRVRRAALDARTDEAKQADIDAARAADDQKAQAKEDADLTLMRKILNWKKGGEPVAIGKAANLNGVNLDKAGYPSSVKLSPTDGSTLSDDKFDLAALFRRKGMSVPESKRRVRELVDAVRAADGAASAPAAPASEAPKAAESKTPTVDSHMELMKSVREGKATPEQFKASYNTLVGNKAAILAELDTKTKVELLRAGGAMMQMRYASERKSEVVEAFYRQLVGEYTLGEGVNYGMGKGSYEAAVRRMVEATDEAKLKSYLEERKAAVAEAQARRAAREQALTDPKTLADFKEVVGAKIRDGMSAQEAFLSLTPEQRIKYDTLAAESTRDRREELKRKAKTQVATAGNTSASEVIATKHTKLGHDLFVVKLADRVERDEYLTLNASAKRLGGSYSSFRGNGAIPGFQFRTREAAEAFRALVEGDTTQAQELAAQRRDAFEDDRSQTAVERLRAMADKLEAQAAEEEGRERKSNTARRARFASAALAGAAADKAKAKTMRNIAAAIEAGNAKFLDEVRTKSQVDMLTNLVATAKYNELRARYPSYADQEKRRGEPPTAETADFAEFPTYTSFRSDLASLAREMLEVEGTKKLGQRLMSVADDVTDAYLEFAKANLQQVSQFGRGDAMADFSNRDDAERAIRRSGLTGKAIVLAVKRGQNRVILSPSEAIGRQIWSGDGDKRITLNGEFGAELVEAIGRRGNKQNRLTVPWQFQNTYDRRKALSRLGIETASEYRSALREFIALKEQALVNRTREMELQMVGRKADGLDFFPTSAEVADQMIEAADLSPDMAVLEPSAGMGHLADRIREAGAEPDVIEISGDRRELLEEKGYHLAPYNDFLQMEPRKFFTYGDVFRAPDGTEGTMRGVGRMGSQRVRLEDENGNRLGLYDRDELTGIGHRGSWSGYDRIIMNPPFSNRRDAEHVMHAYTLLRPGGRIVAIMGEGVFFGQDKKAQEFRDWLESVNGTSEKLPEGSFMDPSLPVNTAVNARMVVIDKPAGDLALPDRDGAGAGAKFSQGLLSPAGNGKKPSRETVQAIVNSFQRAAKETLPITVVNQPSEVNGLVAPSGTKPSGAVFDGRIYLFADNLVSPGDVHVTIFHELFHLGLQRVIPAKDYAALLQQFANNPLVARYVRDWKASPEGQQRAESMTPQAYETLAREEALAMVSEDLFADAGIGSARQPALVKRMLSWLADVADKIGAFGNLGNWIRGLTQTDAEKFVTQMTRAILGGRQNLERTRAKFGTTKANFSKPTNLRQDATEKELADLFKSLEAPRGLKLTQAYRAVDQHPLADKIREVESNFLDILERLDDAGLVQINC